MKNVKIILLLLVAITIGVASCTRNEDLSNVSVIDQGQSTPQTQLDKYLLREFVKPYNIEVQYKLDDTKTPLDYNVTPASEEKATQMINMIKYLCLEVYEKHTPEGFLKDNFPKSIILVGSGAYNNNSTVLLGTAAGGVEITLYRINDLSISDPASLTDMYFNTIYHEFSHILHQKKEVPIEYQEISATDYVGDEWSRFWTGDNGTSIQKGFISNYASKEYHEDFVEMISRYMTLSEEQWQARVNPDGTNTAGEAIINRKLTIVKNYLKDSWNINLDDLKAEVQKRYAELDSQDFNNIN